MSETNYPGFSDEVHPDLFNINAMPKQSGERKPGQLSDDLVRTFFEEGYVVVDNFFDKGDLEACRKDIEGLVDKLAQKLYKAGKISKLYDEYGLFERQTKIEAEHPGANVVLLKGGAMTKALQELWSNEKLLNVIEQLIGPDIKGHPVWNLRCKTPHDEATLVPWHQDAAYLDKDSYKVLIPTAWIPFLDANERNGCLEFAAKAQRSGKVANHQCCFGGTWYVMLEEEEMKKSLDVDLENDMKVVPVSYGSMVLFSNMIPHRSLPNVSKEIRWSVDLRWLRADDPIGFFGLKEGILMRSSKNPDLKVDWDSFNAVDRHTEQTKLVTGHEEADYFEPVIQGPWMKQWEIVHVNKHVQKHREIEAQKEKNTPA